MLVVNDENLIMTTVNSSEIQQMISRYLNGDLSRTEQEKLVNWIKDSPKNQRLFFELKDVWDASHKGSNEKVNEQLLKFYRKQATQKRTKSISSWKSVIAVAAILVFGLVIGSVMQMQFGQDNSQLESFYVPKGSRSEVTLADGTKVNLNSNSYLKFDTHFSKNNRIVHLEGEAYFEVKSDKNHPFTVQTNNFDIVVTGTKFNVSNYHDDQLIGATLAEGKIELFTDDHQQFEIKPGEKISLDRKTNHYELNDADVESETAWIDNEFIFKEIPFPDLIKRLERWYDVRISYSGNELNEMMYSGSFKNQETIWQVLDALKLTSPIDYEKISFRKFELNYKPM